MSVVQECDLGIKGLTVGVEIVKENYWLIKFCLAANEPSLPNNKNIFRFLYKSALLPA